MGTEYYASLHSAPLRSTKTLTTLSKNALGAFRDTKANGNSRRLAHVSPTPTTGKRWETYEAHCRVGRRSRKVSMLAYHTEFRFGSPQLVPRRLLTYPPPPPSRAFSRSCSCCLIRFPSETSCGPSQAMIRSTPLPCPPRVPPHAAWIARHFARSLTALNRPSACRSTSRPLASPSPSPSPALSRHRLSPLLQIHNYPSSHPHLHPSSDFAVRGSDYPGLVCAGNGRCRGLGNLVSGHSRWMGSVGFWRRCRKWWGWWG